MTRKKRTRPPARRLSKRKTDQQVDKAQSLQQKGRLAEAQAIYERILKREPNHARSLHYLGIVTFQQNDIEKALECIEQSIRLKPEMPEYYNNWAMVLEKAGREEDALAAELSALKIELSDDEAHFRLGLVLLQRKNVTAAFEHFRQAIAVNPSHFMAHFTLGRICQKRMQYEEAIEAFRRTLAIKPDFHDAHNELGNAYKLSENLDQAIKSYRKAIELEPTRIHTYSNLADLYERKNAHDETQAVIDQALSFAPQDPYLNFLAAKCEERRGCYTQGLERLNKIQIEKSNAELQRGVHFLLGRLYDRVGEASPAFQAFSRGNDLQREQWPKGQSQAKEYRELIARTTEEFTPQWVDSWAGVTITDKRPSPVFLVGFPRSGTTLLEVALGGHPEIQTLEEKPCIPDIVDVLMTWPGGFPGALRELSSEQISMLRSMYFDIAERYVTWNGSGVLVDKYPLNNAYVSLIYRLFPDAKYIVATRHPCDVCLSCFMQSFDMNAAMANFLSIRDSVRLYVMIMELWQKYKEILPLVTYEVRYERLVETFADEMQQLMEFLELPWDDGVLNHVDMSKSRTIRTPSYRQVSQPVYQHAKYRWRKYAEQLSPFMDALEPFITKLGYGSAA